MSDGPWTCFHCGETFSDHGDAWRHFGADTTDLPACQIKGNTEKGLLGALRDAEENAAKAWAAVHSEGSDAVQAMYAMAGRHRKQLTDAEQLGYDKGLEDGRAEAAALIRDLQQQLKTAREGRFKMGERVEKISGSSWRGHVVGFYSTKLTPEGYAVESENEPGSVQIYPAAAIRSLGEKE